jgi:hypothetical protein
MRYLVYLLLVANVLYLGWNLSRGNSAVQSARSVPAIPAGAPSLVMLHEREAQAARGIDRGDGAETGTPEGTTADGDARQETGPEHAAVLAQQPDPRPAPVCRALGPFDGFDSAETVSGQLAGMGLNPMLRSVDSQVVDDYWVYVPGRGREYARQVIRQLKAGNIEDYYVFDANDYQISLGTFRKSGLAEKKLASLRRLGVEAILEKRYKTRVEHWLELPVEAEPDDGQLRMIALKTPGLQINTDSCLSLAAR